MQRIQKLFITFTMVLSIIFSVAGSVTAQENESTWQRIKRTGELRMAVFNYAPYYVKNLSTGEWGGALVSMVQDAAKELKVKFVPIEVGGWSELVLSITTNKVDIAAGMQATPARAASIDFAGPIYWIE